MRDTLVSSPEPPEIREESVELHENFAGMAGPSEEFLIRPHILPTSLPFLEYSRVLEVNPNAEVLALKRELEELKASSDEGRGDRISQRGRGPNPSN